MANSRAQVFEQTYQGYLEQLQAIDYFAKAEPLGVAIQDSKLLIPIYDQLYTLGPEGIHSLNHGPVTPAIRVMICKYVLTSPAVLPELDTALVTYREFKNSAPLLSYFANNTNKTLQTQFSGDLTGLKKRGIELGGKIQPSEGYDLTLCFSAFPRIPVLLNFNDADELFPAICSLLYQSSAALFLDMESLAMTGTLLAGKLIGKNRLV